MHTYTTCFSERCYLVVYKVQMDLLSHAPLRQSACMYGEARFSSLTVFLFLFLSGILARLSGWQQVRAALYACIHCGPSGLLPGPHRIHGVLT